MELLQTIDYDDPGPYILEAVKSLEHEYRVSLTVHDHSKFLYYLNGDPFLPGQDAHRNLYCSTGRYEISEWKANCVKNCSVSVETESVKKLRPFLHTCWKGCSELVVPVERDRKAVLFIYAGVFRLENNAYPKAIGDAMRDLFYELPVFAEDRIASLSKILLMFGHGMLFCADNYRRSADTPPPVDRKKLITEFIEQNAHRKITIGDLAHYLCVSNSRAGHIVKELFGNTFHTLLLLERMTRARNLLLSSSLSLKEIAWKTSYQDIYHFNRVFSQFFGTPPGVFRDRHLNPRS